MNEEEKLEYSKEDLLDYIKLGKKLDNVVTKHNLTEQLKNGVNRFLDCSQYLDDIKKQYNKSRKIIKKYATAFISQNDIKKYFKDSDNRIEKARNAKFWSVFDLMQIVENIFCDTNNIELFKRELPSYKDWYQFEMKDMIFINTFANSMKKYRRDRITSENIFFELDFAMQEYIDCIQEGYDYKEQFDNEDGFVNIVCKNESEKEEEDE